jgi:hypothetical protein
MPSADQRGQHVLHAAGARTGAHREQHDAVGSARQPAHRGRAGAHDALEARGLEDRKVVEREAGVDEAMAGRVGQ